MNEEVVPVLYVGDAARAVAWYGRLEFVKEWEHQFESGFPWFVSVARGNVRLYLSEHEGDARPDTLIHLYVNDIDAVSDEFGIPVDEAGWPGANATSWTRTATGCASPPGAPEHGRPLARRSGLEAVSEVVPSLRCVHSDSVLQAARPAAECCLRWEAAVSTCAPARHPQR
jgi:hypothetical protein